MNLKIISEPPYRDSSYFRIMDLIAGNVVAGNVCEAELNPESKIVFLDIDNILNRADLLSVAANLSWDPIDPTLREFKKLQTPQFIVEQCYFRLLKQLQSDLPQLNFVIISDWRKRFEYSQLKRFLEPLNIVGVIDANTNKINGILSWWLRFASSIVDFSRENIVILDDNIIGERRPYLPQYSDWMKLVTESTDLDRRFKESLLIPLSQYMDTLPLRQEDIEEIKQRLR